MLWRTLLVLALTYCIQHDIRHVRESLIEKSNASKSEAEQNYRQSRCDKRPALLKEDCIFWFETMYAPKPGWFEAIAAWSGSILRTFVSQLGLTSGWIKAGVVLALVGGAGGVTFRLFDKR
eukprot:Blabericola_migrator_1__5236@NODE_2695_length_2451_cov_247_563339_g1685_i0_p2_GENE_NODE_2695_length_2451_cov_247_563339_g1685_i0NODE_2695_length_2451_cov_247_563339_g1685_i0_p2_ORF_typecomplete_len121_score11_87Brr6_like_C_C/PF10104_9/9_7e08_NODE_2695_length_2451_cov_247_563339_g1685_i010311393